MGTANVCDPECHWSSLPGGHVTRR